MIDVSFFLRSFVTLFSVVDPVSVVPLFMTMTVGDSPRQLRRYARNGSLTATLLMLFFLLFGQAVFQLFDITLTAFRIAGGLILLIIALDLLQATHTGVKIQAAESAEATQKADISVTPLGIPLLGGPGAISTVMVLASEKPGAEGVVYLGIVIAIVGATIYISLRMGEWILAVLGITGINVVSRLLGLLLLAMAVQFILVGFREAYPFILGDQFRGP